MSDVIRRRAGMAMGQGNLGYGHLGSSHDTGRNPGYAKGGHVKDSRVHAGHGHKLGGAHGVGKGGTVGTAPTTGKQSTSDTSGRSVNQFGSKMPSGKGSSLGRW